MEVYVVFYDYGYEGFSHPEAVFLKYSRMIEEYPNIIHVNDSVSGGSGGYVYSLMDIEDVQ